MKHAPIEPSMTPLELYVELVDRYGVPGWITNGRGQHMRLRDVLHLIGDGEEGIVRAEAYEDGYQDGYAAGRADADDGVDGGDAA